MKKLSLFMCVFAVMSAGCSLEEVVERSDIKCEAEYAIINDALTCYVHTEKIVEGCASNLNAMKQGFCPLNLDVCGVDADGMNYCHQKCEGGQVFCGNKCIDPKTDKLSCGAKGNCFAENSDDKDYKGAECASGTTCTNGKCHSMNGCSNDEHEDETGVCVENSVEMCGTQSCLKLPGWKEGECNVNACEASDCKDSYHLDGVKKICVADTPDCCGAGCEDCGDGFYCSKGVCTAGGACPKGQHEGREEGCEDDDFENCGHVGLDCSDFGIKTGDCVDSRCVAKSCSDGFHLAGKACAIDKPNCCGEECIDCKGKACVNGACLDDGCGSGQHSSEKGECEPDSQSACGRYNNDCTMLPGWVNGECNQAKCEATACEDAYHLDRNTSQCVANEKNCCGDDCIQCGEGEECIHAACVVNTCGDGKELCQGAEGNECRNVVSDINNCGGCNSICQTSANASFACVDRKCIYTCDGGFEQCGTNENSKCVDIHGTDVENCGECGKKCASNEYCSAGSCLPRDCSLGQHKGTDGKCVDDTANACGSKDYDCELNVSNANEVECVEAQCYAKSCKTNFHLNGDRKTCLKDTESSCGSMTNNCYTEHVAGATCESGKCKVNACELGYHVNSSNTGCDKDTADCCGASCAECAAKTNATAACTNGKCTYSCNSGTSQCGTSSEPNCLNTNGSDVSNCGYCGTKCQSSIPNTKSPTCSSGTCQYSCNDGYTQCGTASSPNCINVSSSDANNCGSCGKKCASNEYCATNTCKPLSCAPGKHKDANGFCVDDSNTECGESRTNCTKISNASETDCVSGACTVKKCNATYHVASGAQMCEEDSVERCGSPTNNCYGISHQSGVSCSSGKCVVSKCEQKYHVNSAKTGCNLNTDSACGSDSTVCTDTSIADYYCDVSAGKCAFNCAEGNHRNISGTACEADSVKACGSYNNDCTQQAGWSHGGCYKGTCHAVACQYDYSLFNQGDRGVKCVKNTIDNCAGVSCSGLLRDSYDGNYICSADGSKYACIDSMIYSCDMNFGSLYFVYYYTCVDNYDSSWKITCDMVENVGCARSYYQGMSCPAGQHVSYSGSCINDSEYQCGAGSLVCEDVVPGWLMGECKYSNNNGICSVTTCADGYTKTDIGLYGTNIYRCKPKFTIQ